jgi:Proto-chlorophyllide reductase 57 kD subunit
VKFLCVPCDQPMRLGEVGPPDRGSLAVRYTCPACGYEMAMLTNPFETQMVQSLGVRIGPDAGSASADATPGEGGSASKCPFAGMIPGLTEVARAPEDASAPAGEAAVAWTAQAEARLQAIPSFVRPMARTGIERFARERGYPTVDERVLDEARDFFGM